MTMLKQGLLAVLLLAVLAYSGGLGYLYLRQEKLLFQPEVLAADHVFALGRLDRHQRLPRRRNSAGYFTESS